MSRALVASYHYGVKLDPHKDGDYLGYVKEFTKLTVREHSEKAALQGIKELTRDLIADFKKYQIPVPRPGEIAQV